MDCFVRLDSIFADPLKVLREPEELFVSVLLSEDEGLLLILVWLVVLRELEFDFDLKLLIM